MEQQGKHRFFIESLKKRQAYFSIKKNDLKIITSDFNFLDFSWTCEQTATKAQSMLILVLTVAFCIGLFLAKDFTMLIATVFFSVFYFAAVIFRAFILANFDDKTSPQPLPLSENTAKQYVVIAALYRESGQVADLVCSLSNLRWPKQQLQILLVCEMQDQETIAAISEINLPDEFKLVVVPDGTPRTKPRALNYALRQCKGDYLVIYDAEDRPHPDQLLEADHTFANSPPDTVCLQAPLAIDNATESVLTRLFSIEYDTLFYGILPALARWQAPMPLGGTSNHFKLDALRAAGGWDSYNVTEDADLGIRLARLQKTCGTLKYPTFEEAPASFSSWIKQRTRWIKGWVQTLLVHLRNPVKTARQMGWRNFIIFHLVLTSVVVSVLVHPFFVAAFLLHILRYFSGSTLSYYDIWVAGISTFNLVAGYTTYCFLALVVQKSMKAKVSKLWILLFPMYWVLISMAGWRAIWKLIVDPHHWEKTAHVSSKRQEQTV